MVRVRLSQTEIMLCQQIGKLRHEITSKHASDRKQDQRQDSVEISINGVFAEYAVSKALNLHFDMNCDYRKFGADLISQKGATIDVKCTTKEGGNLNAVIWSNSKPADIFVLAELHYAHVFIVGWISKEDFLVSNNTKDIGNGLFYCVPQSKLTPFNLKSRNAEHQ